MQQYIGFTLNHNEYSIPIVKVREIITMPPITKLPQAPSYVEGMTNLRGKIVPIVNIKKLVNIPGGDHPPTNVVVVASGSLAFGVLVDGITGVMSIEESSIQTPDRFMAHSAEQVEGVARVKDRLVVMLDTRRLLPLEDLSMLDDVVEVRETENDDSLEVVKRVQTIGGEVRITEMQRTREFFEKRGVAPTDPSHVIFNDMVEFVNAIGNQDYDGAEAAIQNILKKGQGDLFHEVGKVTRKLHDSLRSFKDALDPRLRDMAFTEMPSAVDRLQYVIQKTEEAANKTMGIVEKYILKMDELSAMIRSVQGPPETVEYLKKFQGGLEDDLTDILTTQSFQDLTGQTIKKVITLVGDIEEELVRLVATFGMKSEPRQEEGEVLEQVSQSGVDDLLKDFGF